MSGPVISNGIRVSDMLLIERAAVDGRRGEPPRAGLVTLVGASINVLPQDISVIGVAVDADKDEPVERVPLPVEFDMRDVVDRGDGAGPVGVALGPGVPARRPDGRSQLAGLRVAFWDVVTLCGGTTSGFEVAFLGEGPMGTPRSGGGRRKAWPWAWEKSRTLEKAERKP